MHRVLRIHQTSAEALRTYVPQRYPGQIVIFRPLELRLGDKEVIDHPAYGDPELILGWSTLSSKPLVIFDVPGNHVTMVLEPHVRILAGLLTDCFGRAEYTHSRLENLT